MQKHNLTATSLAILLSLTTPFSGLAHADQDLAGNYYEKALIAREDNDIDEAIIELKNALQQNQDYVAAHILLGEIYLQQKKLSEAEVQLGLANQLGADRSLTVKSLAQLYLYQIKYKQLIEEIEPTNYGRELQPELHIFRGNAYLQLNQISEALNEYGMASQIDPGRIDAVLGKANALLRRGDIKGATQTVESAAEIQPDNPGIWYTKGSIAHAQGELEAALQSYDKAIELNPDYQDALINRAGILMDLQQDQRAKQDLSYLREHYPFDPKAAYLLSVLLARNGEPDAARKELEAAADTIAAIKPEYLSQHGPSLMLSGLVNYSMQRTELAAEYLRQYVKQYPEQPGPYKLLATILLKKNEPENVVDLLRPVYARHPEDHRLMFLLASAYMQVGKHDQANLLLEKLGNADTIDTENLHTEIGLNRLSMGQEQKATDELEAAFQKDPSNIQAGIPLVVTYITNHQGDKALRVAQAMHDKVSKNLTVLNLLGTAQVGVQQLKQARKSFEAALAINPDFLAAHLNLSKLDVAEKQPEQARQRLQNLLGKFPDNQALLIELATIEQTVNNFDAANQWLEKARAVDQKSLPVLLAQAELKLKMNRASEALRIAQAGELIDKDNWELLNVLARCYLATDSRDKAIGIYLRMTEQARFNVKLLYNVADLQMRIGDHAEAIKTLKKAVLADEKHIPSQIALVEMELNYGKPVFAVSRAQNLLKTYPKQAFPYELLGDIAIHDQDFKGAVAQYQSAFDTDPNTGRLMKLYQTLKRNKQDSEALSLLEKWSQKQPKDPVSMAALANELMQARKYSEAQKYYETLLTQYPNEAMFLNNLAYIYFNTGNAKALSHAEKAQQLAPEQAASNDTLGWILVNLGKAEEGLHYLRNAHSRASQDPEIRYHIAVALERLNRVTEAKQELEHALKMSNTFNGATQAKQLLEKLKN